MQFLTILVTVFQIFTEYVDDTTIFPRTLQYIPTLCSYILDDLMLSGYFDYYKWKSLIVIPLQFSKQSILSNFLLLCLFTHLMADNIQRAMQDLDLGVEDAPVALPIDVVNQAVAENRFIIIGRPDTKKTKHAFHHCVSTSFMGPRRDGSWKNRSREKVSIRFPVGRGHGNRSS